MMHVRGIACGILLCPILGAGLAAAAEPNVAGETAAPRTARAAGTSDAETGGARARIFIDEPRPFGHAIGDLVERTVTLVVAAPASLQTESIPRPGRYGAWLELRKADLDSREERRSTRYRLTLTYQIMKVAPEVQTIELPPLRLSFDGGRPFSREIANWPITVSPLTPEFVLARAGLEALRPDRVPPPIDTSARRLRLWLYAALFVTVLASYSWSRFGAAWLARRPFARAYREIARLERNHSQDSYRAALRAMHRAFDETNGASLFSEHIPPFLHKHPRFAVLRTGIEQFFALSRDEFFGGSEASRTSQESGAESKAKGVSKSFLRPFCRAMREREGSRSGVSHAT